MRTVKLAVAVLFGAGLAIMPTTGASAHVHLITPLLCTPSPIEHTGANQTDNTPAAAANGGPISGVIPVVRSGGAIQPGEGGFGAAVCDHFPAGTGE